MSLKYRIAATIFGLETVLIAIVLWLTLGHSMTSVREQLVSGEQVTLSLVGDLSRSALLTDEFAELQTFVERTKQDPRIKTVVIGDAAGRVVVATDPALIDSPFPDFIDRNPRYWRKVAITSHAGHLGSLAVQFSQRPLLEAYRETRALGVSVAVIGMVLIALVGLGMGFVLTRRVEGLALAADRVADGDTAVRVEVHGRDEVARVGRAFNSMVDRLAENLAALKAARDRLIHPTEAMSEGFALWDAEDRLVLHNRRFLELFGERAGRVALGGSFEDLVRLICTGSWRTTAGRSRRWSASASSATVILRERSNCRSSMVAGSRSASSARPTAARSASTATSPRGNGASGRWSRASAACGRS